MSNSPEELGDNLRNRFSNRIRLENGSLQALTNEIGLTRDDSGEEVAGNNVIKERIEEMRLRTLGRLDKHLVDFVSEINQELENLSPKTIRNSSYDVPDTKSVTKSKNNVGPDDELPDKEFTIRESLLTELFEISHIRTIYHIFVAMLVVLFLQTFLYDLLETGKFNLDFEMIQFAFGKIPVVIMTWLCMKLSVILLVFPLFHFWAYNGKLIYSKKVTDTFFLSLFFVYLLFMLILPAAVVLRDHLPPASSAIVLCEQIRLLMKSYAFVRSNVPRVKTYWASKAKGVNKSHSVDKNDHTNSESIKNESLGNHENHSSSSMTEYDSPCPSFSSFLYFLFAPTLIYRDSYPRMPGPIRWRYVTSNFVQVVACLFYTYYIFQRFCVPVFQRFGHEPMSYRGFLLSMFGCMMPGTLVLLINFFLILHAWLNAFAEMLRFGDRMFYKDWWNSTTYANYYRTWNIVVHDWLYTYVYRDIYRIFKPNRRLPMILVFILSAVVHEYIVSLMFSYFYPVMLVLFLGMGIFFVFLTDKRKSRFWNIFFWVSMFIGPGIFMTIYCTEIYARTNCPQYYESAVLDFFVPRSWVCYRPEEIKPE